MYKKITHYIAGIFFLTLLCVSCKKWDDYKKYVTEGEKVYPGAATDITAYPGNGRVLLTWIAGIDSRVKKYGVFWNNGNDSTQLDVTSYKAGDTIRYYIEQLPESNYTFAVYAYDAYGNKSVPIEVPSVNVYGPKYQAALLNRPVGLVDYSEANNQLTINWNAADTINLKTLIWYTDTEGIEKRISVNANEQVSVLHWKMGTKIYYQSTYKPSGKAIDSFTVSIKDSIKVQHLPVPKNLWKKMDLPQDIAGNAYGTKFSSIWDGQPGGYPNIYHTEGGSLPHHFTIDLGEKYHLTRFEEIGRQDCACHNPVDFEVWGIADITGAATQLPADAEGWKEESIEKGWILLKQVTRTDDGIAPFKVNLDENNPPVRYIRIRILKTLDNNIESHMSEISFWYNP